MFVCIEVTTGLDSSVALEVIKAVKMLSKQNRTIICTIHQPSSKTFALFDKLILLSQGYIIYHGAVKDATQYFITSPLLYEYIKGTNSADFIIAISSMIITNKNNNIISSYELREYYYKSKQYNNLLIEINKSFNTTVDDHSTTHQYKDDDSINKDMLYITDSYNHTSIWYQTKILSERGFIHLIKEPEAMIGQFLMYVELLQTVH
jgi:ABC-type multidrug transport system ATPase subunit